MPEDALMPSISLDLPWTRVRRLGLALLLLAVPACGLSDYEAKMRDAQERKDRFDEEEKYLDVPVQIPTQKNKDDRDEPVANVFFRPPKGIEPKPQAQPRNSLNLWRYARVSRNSDFFWFEMAFASDEDKDFANTVANTYTTADQATRGTREIVTPEQKTTMSFDFWEFSSGQSGYSINVLKGGRKPIAIVYCYNKARPDIVRKAIELSLQSLGIDQKANAGRQRYNQKSPWRLEAEAKSESE